MDPVELSLFASRIAAICEEMAATLKRSAFSPNIRDRLDYSCAVFDPAGNLVGQSAAIPVHLGSMAYAMRAIVDDLPAGEGQLLYNDPAHGGTHLPDVTLLLPVRAERRTLAWVANRAHHADIGAAAPGSMPLSRSLADEGLCIPPRWLGRRGEGLAPILDRLTDRTLAAGDFAAQLAANRTGAARIAALAAAGERGGFQARCDALNDYGERLARETIRAIPDGGYEFEDYLDDDGFGRQDLPIRVRVDVRGEQLSCDFAGTAAAAEGNINCPPPVVAAAVLFVLRCLMPAHTPGCAGCLRPVSLRVPAGSLLDPPPGAAVAAGNVETSTRIVDVLCGALARALPERIPAAAQGTMNNLAMGRAGRWNYYETMAGGHGAAPEHGGASALHSHMTNTLNTPVEVAEHLFPLRFLHYGLRRGSGGRGRFAGGDGLVRELEFLEPASLSLITERRRRGPWGLAGGADGAPGENRLNGMPLGAKIQLEVAAGDRLRIATPGGGGWGAPR